jgi:hypothetical protein
MNDAILNALMRQHAEQLMQWLDEGGPQRCRDYAPLASWVAVIHRLQELEIVRFLETQTPETQH